ncbi:MAG: hypothetical protein WBG37_04835 [Desulfobacterales bacterium]
MAKGNYSIRYDPDKLRAMIDEGKNAREIMKEFKISPYTLWEHLTMLQEKDKKVYFIKGLFDDPEAEKSKVRPAGIVFTKEVLDQTGFVPGDAFQLVVEEGRIVLKKIRND